jgi:hypothetical protein
MKNIRKTVIYVIFGWTYVSASTRSLMILHCDNNFTTLPQFAGI